MTKEQLTDVAVAFLKKNRRLPKPKEFVELVKEDDFQTKHATGFLLGFKKKHVKILTVIDGRVYDDQGGTVWFQSTKGSMMPAAFYPDEGIGQYVSQ